MVHGCLGFGCVGLIFFSLEYLADISRVKSKPEAFQQASKLAQVRTRRQEDRNKEIGGDVAPCFSSCELLSLTPLC